MRSKKILAFLLLAILSFSACTAPEGPYLIEGMPEELQEFHRSQLSEYLVALKENPEDLDALQEVAFRYEQLGNYKKAIKYYDELLLRDKNHRVALNNLAHIYEQMGDYDSSASHIMTLYILLPDNGEVISDTVRILLLAGDPVNAALAVNNYMELKGDDPDANDLAMTLLEEIEEDSVK